jgi:hypothetical protein
MCSVPPLGALNKQTRQYVYPAIASKQENYVCPECDKDLILRKGTIRVAHFAHCKDDNPCHYYSKPTEAQVHKDAKLLLKRLLESGQQLLFRRKCPDCCGPNRDKPEEYEIPAYSSSSQIVIEHRFDYNGPKIADVAYLDNKELVAIFEICNTHRTAETARPEPWFEVDAYTLINSVNRGDTHIDCIRHVLCDDCVPVKCHRCGEYNPRHIMNTNTNAKWCKLCDIDMRDKHYFNVPYADKDAIKKLGGRYDPHYKKWYMDHDAKHLYTVVGRWARWGDHFYD